MRDERKSCNCYGMNSMIGKCECSLLYSRSSYKLFSLVTSTSISLYYIILKCHYYNTLYSLSNLDLLQTISLLHKMLNLLDVRDFVSTFTTWSSVPLCLISNFPSTIFFSQNKNQFLYV